MACKVLSDVVLFNMVYVSRLPPRYQIEITADLSSCLEIRGHSNS